MSDALHSTRLRWHGRRGVAKLHGRSVTLDQPPVLCGCVVHACDYVPEYGIREIQRRACDHVEDMTDDEVHAADQVLRAVVTA